MAAVRVFLPTCRRPRLLERAVDSLRKQTFTDWVCELHNDAPDDNGPAILLAHIDDARFSLNQHKRNLGGAETFNLFFRSTNEPYYSMLEDDNWWEPDFLAKMLAVADANPDVGVFWSNMRIWQERADESFHDTGELVQPYREGEAPRLITWGQSCQIYGAVHSHGAGLFRSQAGQSFLTPNVPIAAVEMFRERLFPYPLVFVPSPLANFSITLRTSRSDDRAEWATVQTMLAATFLKHAGYDDSRVAALWEEARARRPPSSSTLLLASIVEPACRSLARHARATDWLLLLRGIIRRPLVLLSVLRSRRSLKGWWEFLDQAAARQFSEQRLAINSVPIRWQSDPKYRHGGLRT
jgi:hypothetical protein